MNTHVGDHRILRSYLICTLPRSGSWLLCDMLAATGSAGRPVECFHMDLLTSFPKQSAQHHVRRAARSGTTENGVFGGKVHWSQFKLLSRLHDHADETALTMLLAAELPLLRYVWLMRRDKVRQALSLYRAMHSGVWWRLAGDNAPPRNSQPAFDFDTIERLERSLIWQESQWQAVFEGLNIDPFPILYEDLAQDPAHTLVELLEALDLPCDQLAPPDLQLLRQADETSEEWLERYLSMKVRRLHSSAPLLSSRRDDVETATVMNQREIRVAALQRSGHHGVINWIAAQCEQPVLFLNDVQPGTNPFFTSTIVARWDGTAEAVRVVRSMVEPFAPRACLMHSYEDRYLDAVFCDDFETHHDGWVGPSANRWDVIVLRDPFNTFASRMKASWMRYRLTDEEQLAIIVRMWKAYAREALGETALARHRPLVILFNRWFRDMEYRHRCSTALALTFSDLGLRRLSAEYGGSSFDGMSFDGCTEKMPVLERWKHYADDALFRNIFSDPEILELSDALFGVISGTERFRHTSQRKLFAMISDVTR